MTEAPSWKEVVHNRVPKWGEHDFLSLTEIHSTTIYDTDGRPLLEGSSALFYPPHVPNRIITSKNPDGREGRPTNISAYRSVMPNFDAALASLSYIRSLIKPFGERLTESDIRDVASIGAEYGRWQVLRADDPVRNGEVSPIVSSLAKISGGIAKGTDHVMGQRRVAIYRGDVFEPLNYTTSSNAYLKFIIDNLSHTGEELVCPASQDQMLMAIDAIYNPAPGYEEGQKMLGLSNESITMVRKFSQVSSILNVEKFFILVMERLIPADIDKIARQYGVTDQNDPIFEMLLNHAEQQAIDISNSTKRKRDKAEVLANQGLGRNLSIHKSA